MKRIPYKKLAWLIAPLLALLLLYWLIGHLSNTDTLRLIAHYPAGEPPVPEPVGKRIADFDTRKAYERYIAEGTTAVFTETGLYHFEKGGNPVHPELGLAVIAKRDWTGQRLWSVTLPACEWREIAASPDGKYLATLTYLPGGAQVTLWQDGKPAWEWSGVDSRPRGGFHVNNKGRVFVWFDQQLFVVEDGKVIAGNPRLPLEEMTPNMLTRSRLVPDGSAMVSILHSRSGEMMGMSSYHWEKLTMEYRALTINGNKVIPVRKFRVPRVNDKNWQILPNGSVMLADGTVYAPDGTRSDDNDSWYIRKIAYTKDDTRSLWHGDAVILHQFTTRGPHFRAYLARTGRSFRLPLKLAPDKQLREIQTSGNGDYVLTVTSSNDFPPTPLGRLVRSLAKKKLLPEEISRRYIESGRFELADKSGTVRASLSCRYAPKSTATTIRAARSRYLPLKYTLSPDGRRLVILGQRVDNGQREYLHYTWKDKKSDQEAP